MFLRDRPSSAGSEGDVVPSPNFHAQVIGLPVEVFVNVTVEGAVGDDRLKVKFATGPGGVVMSIVFVAVFGVTPFETVSVG